MKRVWLFAAVMWASMPVLALAAGFAPQSIFLSRSPVTEGDTVRIYAIVTNPASNTFSGRIVFSEGSTTIGTVPLSLSAGATQTANVLWQPLAGSHIITATISATNGSIVDTKSETFAVNQKPQPATPTPVQGTQTAGAIESSAGIQQSIETISPPVESAVKPVFTALDGVRQSIANVADQQLASVKSKIAPLPGQVEGASTEAPLHEPWYLSILYTLYFYILTLMRFIVGSAGVFYPVLAVLFLYFMWRMFRRFRRV